MKTLSFVIPVFNEQERIQNTFEALLGFVVPSGLILEEVIFVNDGSTDNTSTLLAAFQKKYSGITKVTIVSYRNNRGKGYAVKKGMLASHSDYTLFFDADISTPLSEINKMLPLIEKGRDVIIGTRKNGKSTVVIHQPRIRELLGKGFTKMTQTLLRLNTTDFTCGFKLFSRRAKNSIFRESLIDGWGYDAEIVFLAKKHKFFAHEVPVRWSNDARTRVVLYKAIPQSMKELFSILYYHEYKPFFAPILRPTLSLKTYGARVLSELL